MFQKLSGLLFAAFAVAALCLVPACRFFQDEGRPSAQKTQIPMNKDKKELAVIRTTEGAMTVEFWPDVAPKTVENFKKLAKSGFYDGTCFHRIIRGFMIQGGDPKTKDPALEAEWGTGGPGYTVKAEFNKKPHVRGVLSMARAMHPDSAGSQFFICHGDARFLDGQYTAFGKIVDGDDVLEKIATTPCVSSGRENSKPVKRIEITSVEFVPAASAEQ